MLSALVAHHLVVEASAHSSHHTDTASHVTSHTTHTSHAEAGVTAGAVWRSVTSAITSAILVHRILWRRHGGTMGFVAFKESAEAISNTSLLWPTRLGHGDRDLTSGIRVDADVGLQTGFLTVAVLANVEGDGVDNVVLVINVSEVELTSQDSAARHVLLGHHGWLVVHPHIVGPMGLCDGDQQSYDDHKDFHLE